MLNDSQTLQVSYTPNKFILSPTKIKLSSSSPPLLCPITSLNNGHEYSVNNTSTSKKINKRITKCSDSIAKLSKFSAGKRKNISNEFINNKIKKKKTSKSETLSNSIAAITNINVTNRKKGQYISISDNDIQKVCAVNEEIGYEFSKLVRQNCLVYNPWKRLADELNSIGFYFTTGQYSYKEIKKLINNWENIKKDIPFEEPLIIFNYFINVDSKQRKAIAAFIKQNQIFQRLCKGIKRSMFATYQRAKSLFLKKENDDKPWTQQEIDLLIELRKVHNKDWKLMSDRLGRSTQNCRDKANFLNPELVRGAWTMEEDCKLFAAVTKYLIEVRHKTIPDKVIANYNKLIRRSHHYSHDAYLQFHNHINSYRRGDLGHSNGYHGDDSGSRSDDMENDETDYIEDIALSQFDDLKYDRDLYVRLPWKQISENVPNRFRTQCRIRWLFNLVGHLFTTNNKFSTANRAKLVKILLEMNVPSESYIDWMELCRRFQMIMSPQCLRQHWASMRSLVADHNVKTLSEILNELYACLAPHIVNDD